MPQRSFLKKYMATITITLRGDFNYQLEADMRYLHLLKQDMMSKFSSPPPLQRQALLNLIQPQMSSLNVAKHNSASMSRRFLHAFGEDSTR
jgi:hypothetical protein